MVYKGKFLTLFIQTLLRFLQKYFESELKRDGQSKNTMQLDKKRND